MIRITDLFRDLWETDKKHAERMRKMALDRLKPTELYLCRKIQYGTNGNLTRFEPVKFPKGIYRIETMVFKSDYPEGNHAYEIKGQDPVQGTVSHETLADPGPAQFPKPGWRERHHQLLGKTWKDHCIRRALRCGIVLKQYGGFPADKPMTASEVLARQRGRYIGLDRERPELLQCRTCGITKFSNEADPQNQCRYRYWKHFWQVVAV